MLDRPTLTGTQGSFYRRYGKRALDLALVLLSAPIALGVIGMLAGLVLLGGGWPLYSQPRLGREGREFRFWKLRSMVADADQCLERHLAEHPEAREEWHTYQKLTHDPRITRLGRILRQTSLDELPQLWNVLKGDMSLVGPRPMLPDQAGLYPGLAYYQLRPGLTGLWQVRARNKSGFAERAEYDAIYEKNVSLAGDLRIIWATLGVVLRRTGQ